MWAKSHTSSSVQKWKRNVLFRLTSNQANERPN
jgi:hypothetical protein